MLARLWWKEYRAFGPAWLIMVLAAAGLQWFLLLPGVEDARSGALTVAALAWAVFYAFAAGSAAFAGERESKNLEFLDALPVGRGTLWLAKSSFAMVSTLGLALMLAGLAALGTQERDPGLEYGYARLAQFFGTFLYSGVAWGLLWSSLSKNPLLAGAMAVVSLAVVSLATVWVVANRMVPLGLADDLAISTMLVAAATAALAISGWVVSGRPRPSWSFANLLGTGRGERVVIRRSSAARSLEWKALREGWTTGLLLLIVGLVLPIFSRVVGAQLEGGIMILAVLAGLVAGVEVFGGENVPGTRRFLVHHGVAPGAAWRHKMQISSLGMAVFLGLLMSSLAMPGMSFFGPGPGLHSPWTETRTSFLVVVVDTFAVGILCGMAIRRRITAAMVGVILLVAIVPAQLALVSLGMVPGWGLILTPMILVAISMASAGDWLLERDGPWPRVRLGLLMAVPFGILGAAYVAHRAFGEPYVGPLLAASTEAARAIPPDQDAGPVLSRAAGLIRPEEGLFTAVDGETSPPLVSVIEEGWDPDQAQVVAWWRKNRAAIELAGRASAMPRARFGPIGPMTPASPGDPAAKGVRMLAQLLSLDAREHLGRAGEAGSWEAILVVLRFANQLASVSPTIERMMTAAHVHHRGVGLAFDWLADPRLSPELIRRALADLKALPELADLSEALRVESAMFDRTLALPADEMNRALVGVSPSGRPSTFERLAFDALIAPPWERQRARRVFRRLMAEELPIVGVEPWQRREAAGRSFAVDPTFGGSPLVRRVVPPLVPAVEALDREIVGRRALVLALAIRAWALDHGGEYPPTLGALVPGVLDRLPLDPYSGRPFGYVRADGQPVHRPILPDFGPESGLRPARAGQPLLYSVGPDLKDDGGKRAVSENARSKADFLFAIP